MPTENRSSNTEMVSVPREAVEQAAELLQEYNKCSIARDLRAILAQPAEQHQGEPVAWVRFRNSEPDYDGDAVMIMNVAGDTLGDGDSWEPVYTHADPGEVERLRLEIEQLRFSLEAHDHEAVQDDCARAENRTLASEVGRLSRKAANADLALAAQTRQVHSLRAQLAERDALLEEVWAYDIGTPMKRRIKSALSASAEPKSCDEANQANGPTFMGEPNPHHSIEWYRAGISKHWKTICDQRLTIDQLTAALKFYAGREHYHFESGNWDTVSGEPLNILWCGEEPDFIEDGTVARNALSASAELEPAP